MNGNEAATWPGNEQPHLLVQWLDNVHQTDGQLGLEICD